MLVASPIRQSDQIGARTLLGAPGLTTSSKEATRALGIATRSKDAATICAHGSHLNRKVWQLPRDFAKLLVTRALLLAMHLVTIVAICYLLLVMPLLLVAMPLLLIAFHASSSAFFSCKLRIAWRQHASDGPPVGPLF